jgi:hypothetical protein
MSSRLWYALVLEMAFSSQRTSQHTHSFPPLDGTLTNDDLLAIRETILPLLMVIPYNQLNGVHSLMAILNKAAKYKANHGNTKFVCPAQLLLYNTTIAKYTTMVIRVCAEAAHKSCLNDYTSYKAVEHGVAKLLCDIVNKCGTTTSKMLVLFIQSHGA